MEKQDYNDYEEYDETNYMDLLSHPETSKIEKGEKWYKKTFCYFMTIFSFSFLAICCFSLLGYVLLLLNSQTTNRSTVLINNSIGFANNSFDFDHMDLNLDNKIRFVEDSIQVYADHNENITKTEYGNSYNKSNVSNDKSSRDENKTETEYNSFYNKSSSLDKIRNEINALNDSFAILENLKMSNASFSNETLDSEKESTVGLDFNTNDENITVFEAINTYTDPYSNQEVEKMPTEIPISLINEINPIQSSIQTNDDNSDLVDKNLGIYQDIASENNNSAVTIDETLVDQNSTISREKPFGNFTVVTDDSVFNQDSDNEKIIILDNSSLSEEDAPNKTMSVTKIYTKDEPIVDLQDNSSIKEENFESKKDTSTEKNTTDSLYEEYVFLNDTLNEREKSLFESEPLVSRIFQSFEFPEQGGVEEIDKKIDQIVDYLRDRSGNGNIFDKILNLSKFCDLIQKRNFDHKNKKQSLIDIIKNHKTSQTAQILDFYSSGFNHYIHSRILKNLYEQENSFGYLYFKHDSIKNILYNYMAALFICIRENYKHCRDANIKLLPESFDFTKEVKKEDVKISIIIFSAKNDTREIKNLVKNIFKQDIPEKLASINELKIKIKEQFNKKIAEYNSENEKDQIGYLAVEIKRIRNIEEQLAYNFVKRERISIIIVK